MIQLFVLLLLLRMGRAEAQDEGFVPLEQLDARRTWRIAGIEIDGLSFVQRFLYVSDLQTKTRPFWVFWRERPEFHAADLEADATRVQRELRAEGFYQAQVRPEVEVLQQPHEGATEDDPGEPGLVRARLVVELGERVVVCRVDLDLGPLPIPADGMRRLRKDFAIVVGQHFTEGDYQGAAQQIVDFLGENGYAAATVERRAVVDVPRLCADVTYRAVAGEVAVFGETSIEGLTDVSNALVEQEIAYQPGEVYDTRKTAETIRRLRGLRLFTIARLVPESVVDGVAPMRLTLTEGPPREIRLGAGYSTEDGVRGLASWSHYNFLGGGRQLSFSARVSQVRRSIAANFLQPHFPASSMKTYVSFTLGQDDESTYVDDFVRAVPRVDWRIDNETEASFFLTAGYDSLSDVSDQSKAALPGYQNSGFTVAPGAGVRWSRLDDPVNPSKGLALGGSVEVANEAFGSDFDWYRVIVDGRAYRPLWGEWVLATRLTAGTIAPYGDTDQIQFWDRFYAGGTGINPVRGYARRRVGPLSGSDDPIGGRSVVVGSLELRHPIWGPLQGVLFVDAGDVELSAWQFRPENIQTGVGFGVRAVTPVGPVELDIGFGLDRGRRLDGSDSDDSLVQVHFTIGPNF
ncbi:MAG: BamA/TamA family outer membrane protein [Thermodesulfobacteriota bacterium]